MMRAQEKMHHGEKRMDGLSRLTLCVAGTFAVNLSISPPAAADTQSAEEIVVTARRVEERLQDVPISISVFNQQQLTDRNVTNAGDLATYTPSLSVDTEFGTANESFSLRGFTQSIGTAPTVGVYFADAVAPRGGIGGIQTVAGDGAGPGDFFDLQNVQVLKGPQGTLFGLNTTGGDILLLPKRPTDQFEGYVQAGFGNYNMEQTQAVVNIPINDKVQLRVGLDQEKRDGYMENVSNVGPANFDDINYTAGRVSLVVTPTDDIENYTIFKISNSDTNGPAEQFFACAPNVQFFGPLSCNQLAKQNGLGPYAVQNGFPNPEDHLGQWQLINTTTWLATDDLTIKNIASYAELTSDVRASIFGDDWIVPTTIGFPTAHGVFLVPTGPIAGQHVFFSVVNAPPGGDSSAESTFSDELQAHGIALNNKLEWQTGLYAEGSHPTGSQGTQGPSNLACADVNNLATCSDPLGNLVTQLTGKPKTIGSWQSSPGEVTYRDYAAYGQGSYTILDNLKFTAGLRVTDDSETAQTQRSAFSLPLGAPPVFRCIVVDTAPSCLLPLHESSRAPTWLLDLEYTPIEDLLTYVKYSRGYRAGGVSPAGIPGFTSFQPEQVDAYEVGAKFAFHGPLSGFIDAAAFYNEFANQQLLAGFQASGKNGAASPATAIVNAGASRIYGFEVESLLKPYQGVTLNASYTYLNSKLDAIGNLTPAPGSPYDIVTSTAVIGNPLPLTPRNKFSATASYQLPVDASLGNISIGATYSYTSKQLTSSLGPFDNIPGYDVVNLNLDWESVAGQPIDVELFVTNLTNNLYATYVNDLSSTLGFATRAMGEPQMFGGRLRVHF
jgi:iron complex outermembrane recepter protein